MYWTVLSFLLILAALGFYTLDLKWRLDDVRDDLVSYRDRVMEASGVAPSAVLIHFDATISSLNRLIKKHFGEENGPEEAH